MAPSYSGLRHVLVKENHHKLLNIREKKLQRCNDQYREILTHRMLHSDGEHILDTGQPISFSCFYQRRRILFLNAFIEPHPNKTISTIGKIKVQSLGFLTSWSDTNRSL